MLTPRGEQHLEEWVTVLDHMSKSMTRFVKRAKSTVKISKPQALGTLANEFEKGEKANENCRTYK